MNENLRTYIIPEGPTELGFGWAKALRQDPAYQAAEYIVIPEGVTTIRPNAFFQSPNQLQAIRIPRSVLTIQSGAFRGCENLSRILVDTGNPTFCDVDGVLFSKDGTRLIQMPKEREADCYEIPEGVTTLGEYAFRDCRNLKDIRIPRSVTAIEAGAFAGCVGLRCIDLPTSVKSIGQGAFHECISLKGVEIPEGVTTVEEFLFSNCPELERIHIPSTVTEIKIYGLDETRLRHISVADGNPSFCDVDGVLFNKSKTRLIAVPRSIGRESYAIPDSVTVIGEYSFKNNETLRQVLIPHSVREIEDWAFSDCNQLSEIVIPSSVTEIAPYAFRSINLEAIRVEEGNPIYSDVDGVLFNEDQTQLLKMPASKPLRTYTLPDSVVVIAEDAFGGPTTLEEIVIPDSVREIEDNAFIGCEQLTDLTIGRSVCKIGMHAFANTYALRRIRCLIPSPGDIKMDDGGCLFHPADATLFVPAAAMEAYRSHPEFGKFRHIEPLPEE